MRCASCAAQRERESAVFNYAARLCSPRDVSGAGNLYWAFSREIPPRLCVCRLCFGFSRGVLNFYDCGEGVSEMRFGDDDCGD